MKIKFGNKYYEVVEETGYYYIIIVEGVKVKVEKKHAETY